MHNPLKVYGVDHSKVPRTKLATVRRLGGCIVYEYNLPRLCPKDIGTRGTSYYRLGHRWCDWKLFSQSQIPKRFCLSIISALMYPLNDGAFNDYSLFFRSVI